MSRGPPLGEGELVTGPTLLLSDGDLRPELVAQVPWDGGPSAITVDAPAVPEQAVEIINPVGAAPGRLGRHGTLNNPTPSGDGRSKGARR